MRQCNDECWKKRSDEELLCGHVANETWLNRLAYKSVIVPPQSHPPTRESLRDQRLKTASRMNTKEFARALRAFAELADFERSHELHGFADFIEQGGNETIFSRLKRLSPSHSYPLRLKDSLEAIETGLKSAGATKQANSVRDFQKLFAGRPGATLTKFIDEISVSPQLPDLGAPRFKRANLDLARDVSRRLTEPCLDIRSFQEITDMLRSPAEIDTATLSLIANLALRNRCVYRDRKMALGAIERHFRAQLFCSMETCDGSG